MDKTGQLLLFLQPFSTCPAGRTYFGSLLLVLLLTGCQENPPSKSPRSDASGSGRITTSDSDVSTRDWDSPLETSARFVEVTQRSGVTFTYRNGQEAGHCAIVESLGGGVALVDYDGDNDMDLFFPGRGEIWPRSADPWSSFGALPE